MSTSPYPELKALSEHDRNYQIYQHVKHMQRLTHYMTDVSEFNPKIESISLLQSLLDRIKQLVLTRGEDEDE